MAHRSRSDRQPWCAIWLARSGDRLRRSEHRAGPSRSSPQSHHRTQHRHRRPPPKLWGALFVPRRASPPPRRTYPSL